MAFKLPKINDLTSVPLMRVVGLAIIIYFAVADRDISTGWLGVFGILFGIASIADLSTKKGDDEQ